MKFLVNTRGVKINFVVNLIKVFKSQCNVEIGEKGEYSHNIMKILVFSNVTKDIQSFSKLHLNEIVWSENSNYFQICLICNS